MFFIFPAFSFQDNGTNCVIQMHNLSGNIKEKFFCFFFPLKWNFSLSDKLNFPDLTQNQLNHGPKGPEHRQPTAAEGRQVPGCRCYKALFGGNRTNKHMQEHTILVELNCLKLSLGRKKLVSQYCL